MTTPDDLPATPAAEVERMVSVTLTTVRPSVLNAIAGGSLSATEVQLSCLKKRTRYLALLPWFLDMCSALL